MPSLLRTVRKLPSTVAAPATLWRLCALTVALTLFVIVRSVGYDVGAVAAYAAYVGLYVLLPGVIVTAWLGGRTFSPVALVALALPTGFAVEIYTYLGLAALGAKPWFAWSPVVWLAAAVVARAAGAARPWRIRVSAHHAGLALVLAFAVLGTAVMAASQMFAESPLAEGLPTRAIFHDWVYLVSRAAVIKNNWPLDDPSLSGTPLQYHYFMMVHAAAASSTAGVELSTVMLRLVFVPLGVALVAQACLLGRAVSRTPWGGVLAALLTVAVSELSFAPSYGEPMFLGLFVRWLFVSPTFFFGMIFCGALLWVIRHAATRPAFAVRDLVWLALLGTAGTGAKGTMLPVVLCALGLWALWRWWRERVLPWRLVVVGSCLGIAFALVYLPTMSAWRTGDAKWNPFHVLQLTAFWKTNAAAWTQALAQLLPASLATPLAQGAAAALVFAGTCGVRLLALPYLVWGDVRRRDTLLVGWLGAFLAACVGMGLLLELNSYGELYVILMMRLPLAVLTAAFFVTAARRIAAWWAAQQSAPATVSASPFAPALHRPARGAVRPWWPRAVIGAATLLFAATFAVQTKLWWERNRGGLAAWWDTPADVQPDPYMQELRHALLWVRTHTEPNAVLVANAFTPENMKKDHWGALDRTLMGVHFYYSALSERRLWFEGPAYIMDTTRARIRANLASDFFYRGRTLDPQIVAAAPSYVLIDRHLKDGAEVSLPLGSRLFASERFEIYRLTPAATFAADLPRPADTAQQQQ